MGRPPCCDRSNVKRGPWTAEEDAKILAYVASHGIGNWTLVPKKAGLNRCGKSCRLRWTNYLRPDLKHDSFTLQEEELIINYHKAIGSRWSLIAKYLPGRTDNDVKNYWNTKLKKKLTKMGIDPVTHKPFSQILSDFGNIGRISNSKNQIGPFIRNFNANLIPESEPSSVTIGPSDSNVTLLKPAIEQVQDNSNMDSSMWGFHSRPQVTNVPPQPFFFNEVTSSCCSSPSSSASVTQLSSPQSYPCQHLQPQAQPTPSSSSKWSDFLITDPVLFLEPDFHGVLSSTKLPTFAQNDLSPINVGDRKDLLYFGERLGQEDLGSSTLGAACGNQSNYNHADASSSVASSFVDGILDKDREMRSQFPLLLDPSFEFQDF